MPRSLGYAGDTPKRVNLKGGDKMKDEHWMDALRGVLNCQNGPVSFKIVFDEIERRINDLEEKVYGEDSHLPRT